ncbi:Mss4 [Trinorchestia longiramus]|nr:Mss4 [Trinorchestia longiramus]
MASHISNDGEKVSADGKNIPAVLCVHCDTCILNPLAASHSALLHRLPTPTQRKDDPNTQTEELGEWWEVNDMFTFENIGFSNTVDDTKYLVCANCDRGPVGYHHIPTKKSFVALGRVKHIMQSDH